VTIDHEEARINAERVVLDERMEEPWNVNIARAYLDLRSRAKAYLRDAREECSYCGGLSQEERDKSNAAYLALRACMEKRP
jgi:hypothetical protein